MPDHEPTPDAAPRDPDAAPAARERSGAGAQRRAVFISGAVLAALLGSVVGFFAVTAGPGKGARDDRIGAMPTSQWLARSSSDAGSQGPPAQPVAAGAAEPSDAGTGERPEAPPSEIDVLSATEDDAGGTPVRGEVRSGVPVIKSLTKLGLSMADAQLIINALDGIFDFRRAQPGQKFEVTFEPSSRRPTRFRYEASLTEVYVVDRAGGDFKGRTVRIPTEKRIRAFGGTISTSLYAALEDLGAYPSLTGGIVDVLSTQVDFYKEQRPGDTFRVLVEEESLKGQFLGYGPVLALEYSGVKAGKRRFYRFSAGDDDATYYDEKGISVPRSEIRIPLHYTRLSSVFGMRFHPVLKVKKLHNGVDFAAPVGTPVWACSDGTIALAQRAGANGNLVSINHGDGLTSHYAHLSRFAPGIKQGVAVRSRQLIGYVGSTGRSTGPHLHFGLKRNGQFIDPLKYKVRPGRPAPPKYAGELAKLIRERGAALDRVRVAAPSRPLEKVPDAETEVLGDEDSM
jgi:murein DD-endopeptidase MepM/ murein hydrolase activator NlpD